MCVARAIYDNDSEFDEELPFQRGDVLRVLSESPGQFILSVQLFLRFEIQALL